MNRDERNREAQMREGDHFRRAIKDSNLFLAKKIYKRGFVTIRNTDIETGCLFYAVKNDDIDMVQFLLQNGHESDGISRDADNNTCIMVAIENCSMKCLCFYADLFPKSLSIANSEKKTPLMLACQLGNEKIAEFLLEREVDVNQVDNCGSTALHYAAAWGYTKCIVVLTQFGVEFDRKNKKGWTAVDYCYSLNLMQFVKDFSYRLRHKSESRNSLISL